MMTSLQRTAGGTVLWASLGTLGIGCSAPPQGASTWLDAPPPSTHEQPLDPLAPGASIVCDLKTTPDGTMEPEFYVVSAMNHKLRYYPELAAALGMDLVTDCDGARKYFHGYAEYLTAHPDFDADEPTPPSVDNETEPPEDEEPASPVDTSKIFGGGFPISHDPVVRLEFAVCRVIRPDGTFDDSCPKADSSWGDLKNKKGDCTGTFINRNWILTAAHCVTLAAVNRCVSDGVSLTDCRPRWDNWGQWTIQGTHGGKEYKLPNQWARAYVFEKWSGTDPSKNDDFCPNPDPSLPPTCADVDESAAHDLALLYVGAKWDDRLAPTLEEGGAARLSIVNPPRLPTLTDQTWQLRFWGWGPPPKMKLNPTDPDTPELRVSVTNGLDYSMNGNVIMGIASSLTNTSVTCGGDSGGPLMRDALTMVTNVGERSVDAIVGVLSSGSSTCQGSTLGAHERWTRVDVQEHLDFIQAKINRWNPYTTFGCKKKPLKNSPSGVNEVEECWGKPCTVAGPPCTADEQCWHPASHYRSRSSCDACGTAGNCDCIVGQCAPNK